MKVYVYSTTCIDDFNSLCFKFKSKLNVYDHCDKCYVNVTSRIFAHGYMWAKQFAKSQFRNHVILEYNVFAFDLSTNCNDNHFVMNTFQS